MNIKTVFTIAIVVFIIFCGWLVIESGVFSCGSAKCITLQSVPTSGPANTNGAVGTTEQTERARPNLESAQSNPDYRMVSAEPQSVEIGSTDPDTGYKFLLRLTTEGAAISDAYLSEFDARNFDKQQPLRLVRPVEVAGIREMTMATRALMLPQDDLRFPVNRLHWELGEVEQIENGQKIEFQAFVIDDADEPVMKLRKIYEVAKDSYHLNCRFIIENLGTQEKEVFYSMNGAAGIGREAVRTDMRQAAAGYRDSPERVGIETLDISDIVGPDEINSKDIELPANRLLWTAAINKYFAGIMVTTPRQDRQWADWVNNQTAWHYKPVDMDETLGTSIETVPRTLAAAGEYQDITEYEFKMYLGPKDKRVFDRVELYEELGFVKTIAFRACCCPAALISPLAFGILTLIGMIYGIIPNYGIAIIILVLMIRILLHPVTKKSQVSMSKFSKIAPMVEEIKKKYGDNKQEMNKRVMELYKQQGASPIMGMLPMLFQMPIWIALYSAIYTSVELRGAAFLPFWITDLSSPDALISFPEIELPLFGGLNSLNVLPLLMGVAMYLQQKLMRPASAAAATTNPQAAQQQKMMMIMMPLMMPLFLYNAPSGLNLYIMASVFAGVVEQYYIRKHIREKEELESKGKVPATAKTGGKAKKKKPKPYYRNM